MMASELRRPESTQKSGRAECFIILNEEKRQLAVLQATPCLAFSNCTVQSSSRIVWHLVGPTSARRAAIHPYINPSILSFAASSASASAPFVLPSIHMSIRPLVRSPARPPCSTSVSPRTSIRPVVRSGASYFNPYIQPSSRRPSVEIPIKKFQAMATSLSTLRLMCT